MTACALPRFMFTWVPSGNVRLTPESMSQDSDRGAGLSVAIGRNRLPESSDKGGIGSPMPSCRQSRRRFLASFTDSPLFSIHRFILPCLTLHLFRKEVRVAVGLWDSSFKNAFHTLSYRFAAVILVILYSRGKGKELKDAEQGCIADTLTVDRLRRQAKTCLAAVAKAVKTTIRPTFRAIGSRFRESHEKQSKQVVTISLTDKSKHTTLFCSKNDLSFRSFHKECFYREKTPAHTSFSQFLPSNEAKMPIECLSDASKMPSWRNLQAAEQPVYGRRSLSCRRQHVGLQGLKKKRICHTQPRKPSGIGTRSDREISKNCLQIRRTQFVLASLQPYILTTLHYYVFIFPLRHFGLSAFRSRQNNTPKKRS